MSVSVASSTRRRRYCQDCGRISRPCEHCAESTDTEPDRRTQLSKAAGMPSIKPYPPTPVNLRRTARELDDAAVVKETRGDQKGADACRQLADLNRQDAAELETDN